MPNSTLPRLLLLEDDPVSARFLRDALSALPAEVEHVSTLVAADERAGAGFDLWLFDARLPDGHAAGLLERLRARGLDTPALALTADAEAGTLERLLVCGFAKALAKPITGDALRTQVRALLAGPAAKTQAWDDDAALAALGSAEAVQALRALFRQELPEQSRRVRAACDLGDLATAGDELHRLKSGCGFVGAAALLEAVCALAADPTDRDALARFEACAGALAKP